MTEDDKTSESMLPEPVRDHLGRQLRTIYGVSGERPRYLGDDDAIPEEFAPHIKRLETRLKTHEEGTGAVEQVLDKILDAFGVSTGASPEEASTLAGKRP